MVFKIIKKLWHFFWGNIIGRLMYSKEYFPKGRWFQTWHSQGWEWVLPDFFGRVLLGRNKGIKWPVSPLCNVGKNIEFDTDDINNFQGVGSYYQTWDAKIVLGKGTYIAQGTGIITSNHDVYDLEKRSKVADVIIGDGCWIGMNCLIMPGVKLGPHTIVGGGSVVTHSFEDGYAVIAGNPAKIIKELDKNKF